MTKLTDASGGRKKKPHTHTQTFQKDGDKMWVEFIADGMAGCQVVKETVLYTFSGILSHHFIYLPMVYFMALLGTQALQI